MPGALAIEDAAGAADVETARRLIRAYVDGLGADWVLQSIDAELATLPGAYGPPGGALLLARGRRKALERFRADCRQRDIAPALFASTTHALTGSGQQDRVLGCVALRRLSAERAEMKRLYVTPEARGLGTGRALAEAVIERAAGIGYREVVLDTLPHLDAAIALYAGLGFVEIGPYYPSPAPGVRFFRKTFG